MKTLKHSFLFLALLGILISAEARSQARRLLVLSPRVGDVVDSTEREYFDLFWTIKNFHEASFYLASGDSIFVVVKREAQGISLPDTILPVSQPLLVLYADRIDHREAFLRGEYVPGSSPTSITYEDGSPFLGDLATQKTGVGALQLPGKDSISLFPGGRIPLARNTFGLYRPMFHTTHFAFSFGVLVTDFSSLSTLNVGTSSVCIPLTFHIELPFAEDPLISIIGGWGFAPGGASGGTLNTFSTALLYRTGTSALSPIVGIGAARTTYSYSGSSPSTNSSASANLSIDAASTYGMLIAGICVIPDRMDLLCSLPLGSDLHAAFEKNSYTITPAVFQVSLLVSM